MINENDSDILSFLSPPSKTNDNTSLSSRIPLDLTLTLFYLSGQNINFKAKFTFLYQCCC